MHFYATVFLPPTPPADVAAAIAAALAPYDRDDSTHGPFDPSATWDSWEPARAATAFPLLPRGLDRLRPGRRRVAFAAPKAAIDFAAMRDRAVRHAAGEFDAWAELTAADPGTRPLSDFDGQRDWLAQPAVEAVAIAAATQRHPYFTFGFLLADPVATLADGRDAYLARAAAQAMSHLRLPHPHRRLAQRTDQQPRYRRAHAGAERLPRIGRTRHDPGPGALSRLNGEDAPANDRPRT